MATIYTRASKGSALTWAEGDANITNLNNAKIELTNLSVTRSGDGSLTYDNTTGVFTYTGPGASNYRSAFSAGTGISIDSQTGVISSTVVDNNTTYAISAETATGGVNLRLTGSDTTTDDVKLAEGSNITLTRTDANTITIASTASGGATTLDGLTDVVITTAATNNVLRYDGTNWVNTAASTLSVSSASTATNATNSTNAANIGISSTNGNANDTTLYPVFVANNATGNQAPHIDTSGLAFNATTNALILGSNGITNTASVVLYNTNDFTTTLTAGSGSSNITLTLPTAAGTLLTTGGTLTGTASGSITGTINTTNPATINGTTANNPKLTIGTGALSSTAWTTSGIGLRVSAATYTDTSSLAGTVAASHIHAIAAPTMASTNIITVTDAGTLYISGPPTAGTNTTITNGWALLANGPIKATAIDNTPIGSTTASTGAFTTLTVNAANDLRLADSDSSNYVGFKSPATVNTNVIWTLPVSDGTNGQVLSTNGSGILSWTSASGGITDIVQDTTPQLGGHLDVNGQQIVSVSNGNIVIAPNGTGKTQINAINYNEGAVYDLGTTGGTIAPDVSNGNVQKITLNSALTMNAFTNPIAGQSLTLIIYGGTAYTSITSTMKFAGGVKTLTGTAGCIDILTVYYDGTTYFASLGKGYA